MEYKKLNDICDIIGGFAFKSDKFTDSGIPVIRIGDISDDYVKITDKTIYISEVLDKYDKYKISKNDILVALSGATTGKYGIYNEDNFAYLNQRVARVKSKCNVSNRYIYHYFKVLQEKIYSKALGCAQPNISTNELGLFKVPIFDLNTELKIIEVLDKSQELIDTRKEQIEKLDELVKSKFIEMFGNPIINSKGWNTKLLGELCELKAGKNIKAADIHEEYLDSLYPCYGGNGLRGYVKEYSHEGSINLIGRQGALCGNVKYAQGKFYATEHAVVTQPKVNINSYWLYFVLKELDLNRLSTGAAQPGLTVGRLNEVEIPIVPIELQNQFADFVKQVDKLKFEMENSLKELEGNFNSLMQKAFKGELFN